MREVGIPVNAAAVWKEILRHRPLKAKRLRPGRKDRMGFLLRFGIREPEKYLRARDCGRIAHRPVSYDLLDVGENPTEEQIQIFEDISLRLRTSNGTYRTTLPNRFQDLDEIAVRWMEKFYRADTELRVQDRAVSHALTSLEWAKKIFEVFPRAAFGASDTILEFIRLSLRGGGSYIVEPDGQPLQYLKWRIVVSFQQPESWRYPLNRWLAARARKKFARLPLPQDWMGSPGNDSYQVSRISTIHPSVAQFGARDPRFQLRQQSVFECVPDSCHILRTMNILNVGYFSHVELVKGIHVAFHALKEGGIWIVGRTLKQDLSNHVTLFEKEKMGWRVLDRLGNGSEIEDLALSISPKHIKEAQRQNIVAP